MAAVPDIAREPTSVRENPATLLPMPAPWALKQDRAVSPPVSLNGLTLAVVIPAYRVAAQIGGVLEGIPTFVSMIVVVDDASPDDTAVIVERSSDPRVHLIRRATNGGVGAAMLTGYRFALEHGADIIVKLDGDGQMDSSQIGRLVEPIIRGDADYVKGNRFVHTRQLAGMPVLRRVGNTGLSFLVKVASGYWPVFDPTNGFTAIHARALEALVWEDVDPRWFFETSMLIELGLVGAVTRDVYMPARYGAETSSLSIRETLVSFPPRLIARTLRRIWLRHFVQDFTPLALFLVAGALLTGFGALWGIVHWIQSAQTGTPASTGTVMIAVLPLILGTQLLLQSLVLDIQNTPKVPLIKELLRGSETITRPEDVRH
ncbi:MAG TPA: glycosyltransferase family 2 protein [Candidatus Limnocylindria bacterium]|jgi:hypothetical protein|nr:glycosyltransferase family 2 protein [Candidatus Limnocylindria bacterium]